MTLRRSHTAQSPTLTVHHGARTTRWEVPGPGESVREISIWHNPRQHAHVPLESRPLIPPYHWHWYQDETFKVLQGRFIFTLEGRNLRKVVSDGEIVVPRRARHTFRVDETAEEPCIIQISSKPEASGLSEKFFRNIYTYLSDCDEQNCAPSLPQLLLFLDSAEVSLALPGPTWISHPISWLLGVVVGRILGGMILGYSASYPEYYDPTLAKKHL